MSDEMNLDLAPAWRPVVGDVLVGEVTDVSRGWSDQSEKYYPIVTVRPEKPVRILIPGTVDRTSEDPGDYEYTSTPVAVHAFHTTLYMRLTELRPTLGERIGIKYVSATVKTKEKGRKGNTPAIYNVRVDGREGDVWSAMEVDPRLAAAQAKARATAAEPSPVTAGDFPVPTADADDDIPF